MRSVIRGLVACPWIGRALVVERGGFVEDVAQPDENDVDDEPVEADDNDYDDSRTGHEEEFYPATWDRSFGSKETVIAMDAILFPDPMAPPDVLEAARVQCMDEPHVLVTGVSVKDWGDDEFRCAFRGATGAQVITVGHKYPPPNGTCKTFRYARFMNGPFLACRVPKEVLATYSENDNVVNVTLVGWNDMTPQSSLLQVRGLWGNGVNDRLTAHPSKKYRVAIHNMYKNNGAKISNWIEWHLAKGVEHFFLYDNNSEEDDTKHLEPYEKRGLVTRIRWPFCCGGTKNNLGQRVAMNHALFKYGQVSDWIISLDADEFMTTDTRSIADKLDQLTAGNGRAFVGVAKSWIMQPGCKDAFGPTPALENGSYMGSVMVSKTCPPKMANEVYRGKYFVKTSDALRMGFTYTTPHPDVAWSEADWKVFNCHEPTFGIAHFRRDYANSPASRVKPDTMPLYHNFMGDFERFAPALAVLS